MLRLGLTGGIGAGKSTVSARFIELGAVLVDADVLAREVVEPGTDGLVAVVERFGAGVLDDSGALDRKALGALVFGDDAARRDLEAIIHPAVARAAAQAFAAASADAVVVHDVPLLVEKQMGPGYHLVLVVDTAEDVRLQRLIDTRGMTEDEARARIAAQATDDQRRAAADLLLDNNGTPEQTIAALDALWHNRIRPYADNVAVSRRTRRPDVPTLVESDPSWLAQGERLCRRLAFLFGGRAATLDHIGSTAVPGLIAKDVIDLQVGVRSLQDVDDNLIETMAEGGFLLTPGNRADNGKDAASWPKRYFGGCDPGQIVHVHVREVGSPGWRWALCFRDWLRADDEARAAYAQEKVRLAASAANTTAYAEAKEPWFDRADAQMRRWADRTGWTAPH